MTISNKSRRLLWTRSGNQCAICGRELTINALSHDKASVIGEECHIVSPRQGGPRYDPGFPPELLDSYENLILLCRVCHKLIDDNPEQYPRERLAEIKLNHEKRVAQKLSESSGATQPVRIRRKNEVPILSVRISSGKELANLARDACAFYYDYDSPTSEQEMEVISKVLEMVQDLDVYCEEAADYVRAGFELDKVIKELEELGFYVFGAREEQIIEGGTGGTASWPVCYVAVLRKTNEQIIDLSKIRAQ